MQSGSNESEYVDLVFERIDDASVLSNFYCGICNFTPAEPPLGYKDTLRMYKVLHPIKK
jgi:hypothetical protein